MTLPPHGPAEPCPSTLLQQHMAELLREGPDVAPSFLNSVLNQLNWAFSEFIGMIQEVGHGGSGGLGPCCGPGTICHAARPLTPACPPAGGSDPTGCRAPRAELCRQPAAQGVRHLL